MLTYSRRRRCRCIAPLPAAPDFAIETMVVHGTVVIRVSGELDLATVGKLRQEMERSFTEANQRLILDCRGLTFLDSSGVSLMLAVHRDVGREAMGFLVAPGAGAARRVLEITGVARHLTLIDDPDVLAFAPTSAA